MTGFEPAISALTGQRVWPLHYTPEAGLVYHTVLITRRTLQRRSPSLHDPLRHHRSSSG